MTDNQNTRPDREAIKKLLQRLSFHMRAAGWNDAEEYLQSDFILKDTQKFLSDAVLSLMPEAGWRDGPDWKRFGQALVEDWPTGDIDGSFLFDMCLKYNVIRKIPGGFDPDQHIDAEGICPDPGDPWYEYVPECAPTPAPDPVKAAAAGKALGVIRGIEAAISKLSEQKIAGTFNATGRDDDWRFRAKLARKEQVDTDRALLTLLRDDAVEALRALQGEATCHSLSQEGRHDQAIRAKSL